MAFASAFKVIDCEDRTREVIEANIEYYFAAVGPAGTGKATTIR